MMRSLSSLHCALLYIILCDLAISYDQSFAFSFQDRWPVGHQRYAEVTFVAGRNENRVEPKKDTLQGSTSGPAREIKRFTEPTIVLRGTAQDIGMDGRTLADFLEKTFLEDFGFLQSDFEFDKTYETWEIGLFECEAWTVGRDYPIALHIQCAGGSMDEPGHWHTASLGYGPKDKIVDMVRKALDSIVTEYATFVRQSRAKLGS